LFCLTRPAGVPKPGNRLKRACSNCVKFYDSPARRTAVAAKKDQLQAQVVMELILRLMANGPLFREFC